MRKQGQRTRSGRGACGPAEKFHALPLWRDQAAKTPGRGSLWKIQVAKSEFIYQELMNSGKEDILLASKRLIGPTLMNFGGLLVWVVLIPVYLFMILVW